MEEANDGMIIDTTFVDWDQETSRFLSKQLCLIRVFGSPFLLSRI